MLYAAHNSLIVSFDSSSDRAEWLKIFSTGFKPVTYAEARRLASPEQRHRADAGYCLASKHYQKTDGVWLQAIQA